MAVRQLPDGRWICYYRVTGDNGKSTIKKEYFGRGVTGEAAARERDSKLDKKKTPPTKKTTRKKLFLDLATAYGSSNNFSDNSLKHLNIRLESNILPVFWHRTAINITEYDMDRYVQKRVKDGVKFSTIRREITDIQAILNWAISRRPKLIPYNPVRAYKKPKNDDAIIMPPTVEETERILKVASPHLIRAIMMSYYMGLRPGAVELLSLKWRNINWETRTIRVISAQKGGVPSRLVPIHEDFFDQLKIWYEEDKKGQGGNKKKMEYIIHYHGRPIKKIQTSWAGALDRAKITRRIRPYDMRHHFITRALEEGADLKALSEVVGSKPETIVRHYQHVTTEMHRRTVAKIPALKLVKNDAKK